MERKNTDRKSALSRITIDIPKEDHKRLKAIAALEDKSIREIVIESINTYFQSFDESKQNDEHSVRFQKSMKTMMKKYAPALKKLAKM